jgi:nucleotide-binding universal stress UspA family protein
MVVLGTDQPKRRAVAGDYRILVAIDLKIGMDRLLAEAQRFAQAFNAIVDMIHIVEPDPTFVGYIKAVGAEEQYLVDPAREPHAEALREERLETQFYGDKLRAIGVRVGRTLTVQGPTLSVIVEEAQKLHTDLLILGSHHHGALYRFWYGDTATAVAAQPPCALLLIPIHNQFV